ncbi:MAG: L-histidine N(alpha)-methyltransferase [Limisphaerales bacterium]
MKLPAGCVNVVVHPSQFPENVRRDLLMSLRTRRVNHKFHYDSVKQTQKWLALHQAYSPTRKDAGCRAIYEKGFAAAVAQINLRRVDVIGLGCGGGQKDTRLLKMLKARDKEVFYTPCDVSAAMVLTARETALAVLPGERCVPCVFDLATTNDLPALFGARPSTLVPRLFTFFGMIPNFEPQDILPKLAALIRPKDLLLFSANLAPGADYAAGMKKILPQYDNALTRDWLMTFLFDPGVGRRDGDLKFTIEEGRFGLKRVVARFHFRRACRIEIEDKAFNFKVGDSIQLFFSYRYTSERVRKILARYKLKVCEQWIAKSEEEGVFLCCKP